MWELRQHGSAGICIRRTFLSSSLLGTLQHSILRLGRNNIFKVASIFPLLIYLYILTVIAEANSVFLTVHQHSSWPNGAWLYVNSKGTFLFQAWIQLFGAYKYAEQKLNFFIFLLTDPFANTATIYWAQDSLSLNNCTIIRPGQN